MANNIGPRGFVPSRYRDATPYTGAANLYHIPASDLNQYNPGDAVKSSPNADQLGVPDITKIINGTDAVRGVIVGVLVSNPNGQSVMGTNLDLTTQSIPSAKLHDYYVMVADDPAILFEIQDDGAIALTATSANKNATFSVANPTFPQQNSATVLNTSSVATSQTLNLRIMGLVQKPNNSFGANANWLVFFNQHEYQGNVSGI
jgi:hypothetical protein